MILEIVDSADKIIRTKWTFRLVILLAVIPYCQPQTNEALVRGVFPGHTKNPSECMPGYECLPHNLCPNNPLLTTGAKLIDIKEFNRKSTCGINKRCCLVSNNSGTPQRNKCSPGHVCVLHYLCQNNTILKTGHGLINLREKESNDECPKILERCCSIDKILTKNSNECGPEYKCVKHFLCANSTNTIIKDGSQIIDLRENDRTNVCPDYLQTCCHLSDTKTRISVPPISDGCGFRKSNGVGFRISGAEHNEAEYAEFPWMIAVLQRESHQSQTLDIYQCGGSLIHPSVVLTVGHSVADAQPSKLLVRAGEWDTQTLNEPFPYQDREVVEIVIHDKFNKDAGLNDIALLFLAKRLDLAANVEPICLPPPNFNFDDSACYVTGWGKKDFGSSAKYQVILKKIDLSVVPRDICQNQLRKTRVGPYFELHQSLLCAGGEKGKDACTGDGGSPLVCPIPDAQNRYYQAGIVAWGIGCGDENVPGVYADVAHLRPWIDEQLAKKEIDPSFFTP